MSETPHSEESNDMVNNHPDIENLDKIRAKNEMLQEQLAKREELKQQRREEKRIAEEKALQRRKETALKGMKYLLSVSEKFSDFFRDKIFNHEKVGTTKPLQERNRLQPTVIDMKEAAEKRQSTGKAFTDVTRLLKFFEGGELRQYQIDGVQWMSTLYDNGINGILADEMGLGKTVQVIALISHLVERKVSGPYLVVAPLSTIPNWDLEFKRFAPKIPVVVFHGSEYERMTQYKLIKRKYEIGGFETRPVVLTTYQVPLLEANFLKRFEWQYIIIDEGHRVKNHETRLSVNLRSLNSSNRLLLTGTPLQNNITELWSLLNFLMPHIFTNVDTFASLLMLEDIKDENKLLEQEAKTNFLSTLHRVLEPFVLRRIKTEVLGDIVPKKELSIYCPLSKLQRDLYSYVISKNIALLRGLNEDLPLPPRRRRKPKNYYERELSDDDFSDHETQILEREELETGQTIEKEQVQFLVRITMQNPMMMFKKIVNHPYLVHFPLDPNASKPSLLINEDLILSSGKLMVLDKMLAKLKQAGHKVLIFSTLVMTLDLIEEMFIMRNYTYCRLDGSQNLDTRKDGIESFNKDPDILAFLVSTRAGGLGLNLTGADTVIFFDRDWNPQVDLQAQDRCHRIGQTKPVMVYTLVTKNTIDEQIINKGYQKRVLEKLVIKNGKFHTSMKKTDISQVRAELEQLQTLLKEPSNNFDDSEMDRLLDRSELLAQMSIGVENIKKEVVTKNK